MQVSYSFINGDAKERYFENLSKINVDDYPHREQIRVWPGQMLPVIDTSGETPMVLYRFRVTDLTIDDWGLLINMFEMTTSRILRVGVVPVRVPGTDIALRLPTSALVDRTVRASSDGKNPNYSLATSMVVINKKAKTYRDHHIKPWHETIPDFFKSAESRAEATLFYMEKTFKFQEGV